MSAALLLVGIQNPLLPRSAPTAPGEDAVATVINRLQPLFDTIVAIHQRAPADEPSISIADAGRAAGTNAHSRFPTALTRERWNHIVVQPTASPLAGASAFIDNLPSGSTGLADWLRDRRITDLYLAGLAADYSAKLTALDGLQAGFRVHVVIDACRGRGLHWGDIECTLEKMREAGARIIEANELLAPPPEVLHRTKFLNLVERGSWVYATRPNAKGIVTIAAVTYDDRLLLVEQFRAPVGTTVIELPAGLAGDDPAHAQEGLAEAARRELLEETGYEAEQMQEIITLATSAGMTDEAVTLFIARGLKRMHAGGGVTGERIVLHEVPLDEVDAWIESRLEAGALVDGRVYAGLYFLQKFARE